MTWLNQTVEPSNRNPLEAVHAFLRENGTLGLITYQAFTNVDPFHCYYGEDCNPDEYLRYAERFVEALPKAQASANKPNAIELFVEVVRRCFGPTQVVGGFATIKDIEAIAEMIHEAVETYDASRDERG